MVLDVAILELTSESAIVSLLASFNISDSENNKFNNGCLLLRLEKQIWFRLHYNGRTRRINWRRKTAPPSTQSTPLLWEYAYSVWIPAWQIKHRCKPNATDINAANTSHIVKIEWWPLDIYFTYWGNGPIIKSPQRANVFHDREPSKAQTSHIYGAGQRLQGSMRHATDCSPRIDCFLWRGCGCSHGNVIKHSTNASSWVK